ncbi:MAG: tetratricopeptide repeat protein [Saprospiraceae bacterium]
MKYFIIFLAVPLLSFSQNKGVSPNSTNSTSSSGQTYAVVVGISDYQDKDIPDLRFADKDAEAFANFLRSNAGGNLDHDHLKLLVNEEATMAQFANALDWLWEVCKEGDQAIIYFSGHGDVEKKSLTQPGFLLCWDAPARVYMAGGAFALPMLQEVVSTLSIQNKAKVLVITDACRSGTLAGSSVGGSQATAANLAKQFGNEIKIMSCQPNEYSIEGQQWGGGRGAFSYHLLDALYGLADNNKDLFVTLQEVGRYLEDHVTNEVAPVSQMPMVVGNRNEQLAKVDKNILASIMSGKSNQTLMLSAIESRGIEEEVLKDLDSSIHKVYHLFKNALKEKVFFEPVNACADSYYEKLIKEPKLERLHSTIKRNYAAALQDDAQQVINIWLKADVKQLECIGKSIPLEPISKLLEKASSLLGENHYMSKVLISRKLLFEGVLLSQKNRNPNKNLAIKCISKFNQAILLEPSSPINWHQMSLVYLYNLNQIDSAIQCIKKVKELAPNWLLPLVDVGFGLIGKGNFKWAKYFLDDARSIDSLHPYVIQFEAEWYYSQGGSINNLKAIQLYEEYLKRNGPQFPCWYYGYSNILKSNGRQKEALQVLEVALSMDSTEVLIWSSLGRFLSEMKNYEQAETAILKAISLDSTNLRAWFDLGLTYQNQNKFKVAEIAYKKAISLDSSIWYPWSYLGLLYLNKGRFIEAESTYLKYLSQDSTDALSWSNLGLVYSNLNKLEESEQSYRKSISLDSTNTTTWSNLGLLYSNMNKPLKSENAYLKSISLDSTNTITWSNLGLLYFDLAWYEKAEHACRKSISFDSSNYTCWSNLGLLYSKMKRFQEAEGALKQSIALNSKFPNPNKHLGIVYFKMGQMETAKKFLQKAIELDQDYLSAYLGMSYVLISEHNYTEAIRYIELAIQKKATQEQLEKDDELSVLRNVAEWNSLMKKYFPETFKN